MDEFSKYAIGHKGISSLALERHKNLIANYISPTIIEERQLNIATMDVFSRLMMDRIIFLGVPIDDYVANIIQAQLLFLESVDSKKDIQIYLNTPGGSVYAGLGIYDTMQYINPHVAMICTGVAASMGAPMAAASASSVSPFFTQPFLISSLWSLLQASIPPSAAGRTARPAAGPLPPGGQVRRCSGLPPRQRCRADQAAL